MKTNNTLLSYDQCNWTCSTHRNSQGLAELHTQAKIHFKSSMFESCLAGHDDIIERISLLEIVAHENARDGKFQLDDRVYDADKFILDLVQ